MRLYPIIAVFCLGLSAWANLPTALNQDSEYVIAPFDYQKNVSVFSTHRFFKVIEVSNFKAHSSFMVVFEATPEQSKALAPYLGIPFSPLKSKIKLEFQYLLGHGRDGIHSAKIPVYWTKLRSLSLTYKTWRPMPQESQYVLLKGEITELEMTNNMGAPTAHFKIVDKHYQSAIKLNLANGVYRYFDEPSDVIFLGTAPKAGDHIQIAVHYFSYTKPGDILEAADFHTLRLVKSQNSTWHSEKQHQSLLNIISEKISQNLYEQASETFGYALPFMDGDHQLSAHVNLWAKVSPMDTPISILGPLLIAYYPKDLKDNPEDVLWLAKPLRRVMSEGVASALAHIEEAYNINRWSAYQVLLSIFKNNLSEEEPEEVFILNFIQELLSTISRSSQYQMWQQELVPNLVGKRFSCQQILSLVNQMEQSRLKIPEKKRLELIKKRLLICLGKDS